MWRATVLAVGCLVAACAPPDDALVVFSAASLADIAHVAAEKTPDVDIRMSVGATSTLSRQIEHGAPADVFLAAHPLWAERLVRSGDAYPPLVELATGQLVIVGASTSSPAPSVADALASAARIAVADPSHVPAGQYAREALKTNGVWASVEDRILPVSDVRAALVSVQRGAADVAIVYASDAIAATDVRVVYAFSKAESPEIRFVAVAVSDDPRAEAWIRQLASAPMAPSWQAHGFEPVSP